MRNFKILKLALSELITVGSLSAQTWTQTAAPTNIWWDCIASSADGSRLVAVSGSGNAIYTSADSGTTWFAVTNPPIGSWNSVASSADGARLVVAGFNSPICTSTNFGAAWSLTGSLRQGWQAIASSADGTQLLAAAQIDSNGNPGLVFRSTDSGGDWTTMPLPRASWRSVASSSDGTTLIAVCSADTNGNQRPIFLSTNSAASWTSNNMPVADWEAVACSSDGTRLVAGDYSGMIYTSTNSGATWNSYNSHSYISSVACSSDGTEFIAVGDQIYLSTNSGAAWELANAPKEDWSAVAASADGVKLAATSVPAYDGGIFLSGLPRPPRLSISSFSANLVLSWIVPSTNLILQQNPDLTATNWHEVTNTLTLNLTNLQEEVTLPLPASNSFYRLATQ